MANEGFDYQDFSIQDTKSVGDYEAAEAFLSATDDEVIDPAKLKTIKEAEEEAKKKELQKKKPISKKKEEEKEEEDDTEEEDKEVDVLGELDKDDEDKDKEKETEEGKEEDKDEDKDKEAEAKDKEKEPEGNTFEELSKDLFRLQIFTQQDDDTIPKSGAELLQRFQQEGQLRATQWLDDFIGRYGDDRKQLFEDIFINGVDPSEYIPVYNEVQNFEGMDMTVEENQKSVYREFYRRLGMADDKVEKRLAKTIEYGDLENEVPDLHEQLVSQDKTELTRMAREKEIQRENQKKTDLEYRTSLQKTITEALKTREFNGIPVTDKKAKEAFDFLYSPKYKTPNGQLLTEFDKFILESKKPENLSKRLIIALLQQDNFDFKNIKKQAVSQESNQIFNSLATKVTKDKTRATKSVEKTDDSLWSSNF